jgi:SpoVK/Ycf46/Vps4 family AAA+-type ATPase
MEIGLPDGKTRREIMEVLLRDKPIADDIQLGNIIGSMDEYNTVTGGNLELIVRNASLQAIREHAKEHGDNADEKAEEITITKKHFDRAINRVLA